MKKLRVIGILSVLFVFFSVVQSTANSGSITLTSWQSLYEASSGNTVSTAIFVSNVGSNDITVTLRLYDSQGRKVGDSGFLPTVTAGSEFSSVNSTGTVGVLPAGKSSSFTISGSGGVGTNVKGYGQIEWASNGNNRDHASLIASGYIVFQIQYAGQGLQVYTRDLVITKDQPF